MRIHSTSLLCALLASLVPPVFAASEIPAAAANLFEEAHELARFPYLPDDLVEDESGLSKYRDWYTKRDEQLIARLANLNFYASAPGSEIGIVPKLHNTSVAIEVYDLPRTKTGAPVSKQTFENTPEYAGIMKRPGKLVGPYANQREGKKIAKFKPSVMGCESESGLATFHLARLLGCGIEVPVATYRTVSVNTLVDEARRAHLFLSRADTRTNPSISEAWYNLCYVLKHKYPSIVCRNEPNLAWGSLQAVVSKESDQDLFNKSPEKQPFFAVMMNPATVRQTIPGLSRPIDSDEFKKALQQLTYIRDFSTAMILDEIMYQRDRFGNFSKILVNHSLDFDNRLNVDPVGEAPPASFGSPVALERMLLKDNDDGLCSKPSKRSHELYSRTTHVDPLVYRRLQWLSDLMTGPQTGEAVQNYFLTEVGLRATNYNLLKGRLVEVAAQLKEKKHRQLLCLDLSLEDAFLQGGKSQRFRGSSSVVLRN